MRILDWKSLTAEQRREALRRPAQRNAARVAAEARDIIERVRREGDGALQALTEQFDGTQVSALQVTQQEFEVAERALSTHQHAAIERAIAAIHRFHAAQMPPPLRV